MLGGFSAGPRLYVLGLYGDCPRLWIVHGDRPHEQIELGRQFTRGEQDLEAGLVEDWDS